MKKTRKPCDPTVRQRILEHVAKNPGCTSEDIAKAFPGQDKRNIVVHLGRLKEFGKLENIKVPGDRLFHWSLSTGKPAQPERQGWIIGGRDVLVAALFGIPNGGMPA